MVFGGYNLKLQGIDNSANDIDIVTTDKGIGIIAKTRKEKVNRGNNWKGCKFVVNGLQIDVITEEGFTQQFFQKYLQENRINIIYYDGVPVFCLKLSEQRKGYEAILAAHKGSNDPTLKIELLKKYEESNKFTPEQWYVVWKRIFEENLLADLYKLVSNQPQQSGGLNFVIVLMCLVTMDLVGKLICGSNNKDAIRAFIKSEFFQIPKAYNGDDFADIINTELRNNLAHAFFPERNIAIGRNTPFQHFNIIPVVGSERKLFWIDADELHRDLLQSLDQYKAALIEDKKQDGDRLRSLFVKYVNENMLTESINLKGFMEKNYKLDVHNYPISSDKVTHTTTLPPETK